MYVFEQPAADRLVCTLEEWRKNVDMRDIARLESIFQDLLAKKYDTYDLYYRAVDRNGELLWINSRGKCFAGPDGRPLYVLGRLSRAVPAELPSSASDFQIAELKKETRKLLSGIKDGFLLLMDVDDLKSIILK